MRAVSNPKRKEGDKTPSSAASEDGLKKCIVTGEMKPKDEMIRFVLDPENRIVPDLSCKLPGRGLWVSADRAILEKALAQNPFSRAAKTKASVSKELLTEVERLLVKRILELLGLARGAGLVVTGQPQVEASVKSGESVFLIVAADAGGDGLKKLESMNIPLYRGPLREALGSALGHDHLVYLGFKKHPLTRKIEIELLRWQKVALCSMKGQLYKENQ
jgi:predicted RNA-binding protein YlxR (DUF448 family)